MHLRCARILAVLCCLASFTQPASAQQTGSISGKAVDTGGAILPGVTVEASSDVLPSARVTTTGAHGEFSLPALPPGNYTVTFTLSGMLTVTRKAQVQLSQDTVVDAELGVQGVSETVTVTASATLIDKESASVKSGLSSEQISGLPVAQEYRDLIRLIPAVQFTQDQTRGPSAGGSGQDNVYQFDGVNVTLPLFGTLSAEPASHDVAQITVIKGGARAVDFDRSGGFSIDSVSKSGTSRYAGQFSYQFQTENMAADLTSGAQSRYKADRSWLDANVGGPVLKDRLFFYGSYLPARERAEHAREPLRRSPEVREHPGRRVRQAHVHADAFGPDQRQLPQFEARRHELGRLRVQCRRKHRKRLREPPENRDRRGLLGRQQPQLRDGQVHRLHAPDARPSGLRRERHDQHDSRHASGSRQSGQAGSAHRAAADRGADDVQRLHPAVDRPLRLQPRRNGHRRRHHRLQQHAFRQRRFLPQGGTGRLQPHAWQHDAPHDPRGLSAVCRF